SAPGHRRRRGRGGQHSHAPGDAPLNLWVVVPAAGIGRRFGGAVPKQYQAVAGQPVIAHSLARLLALDPAALVVVLHRDDPHWPALAVAREPRVIAVSVRVVLADSVDDRCVA